MIKVCGNKQHERLQNCDKGEMQDELSGGIGTGERMYRSIL